MKRFFIQIIIFFCCSPIQATNKAHGQGTVEVGNAQSVYFPERFLSYIEDTSHTWTIDSVIADSRFSEFQYVSTSVFSKPPSHHPQWFKVTLRNTTRETIWLEVNTLFAWTIDLYGPDSTEAYQLIGQSGLMSANSDLLFTHKFWLPLQGSDEEATKTYIFRVTFGGPMECPVTLGTLNALHMDKSKSDFLVAGFLGVMLVMLAYNLMLFFFFKDRVYLYYVLYLFFMVFPVTYGNGYPLVDILYPSRWWHEHIFVWFFPAFLSMGLFSIHYLQLYAREKFFYYLISVGIILFALLALLNFWIDPITLSLMYVVALFTLGLACLVAGYKSFFSGYKQARFYMLGWTVLIVSMSVYFFTLYGFLTYNVLTRNITYFAIGIEVVLFALALVDRINIIRKQHKKAQDDLVMATIKNENIILQYNQELESEVTIKTMELAEKAKNLECANKEITAINEEMSATVEELHETLNKVKEQSEIIKEQSEEILKNNLNLELIIAEKTNLILVQNEQLKAYAHANSHKVRGPLARIMGLITLLSIEADKQKGAEYMRMLEQCAGELDLIIREMNAILLETGYYSTQEVHN